MMFLPDASCSEFFPAPSHIVSSFTDFPFVPLKRENAHSPVVFHWLTNSRQCPVNKRIKLLQLNKIFFPLKDTYGTCDVYLR